MEREIKRVVYDGISIGVRALTVFLALGLLLMALLTCYGAYMGVLSSPDVPAGNGKGLAMERNDSCASRRDRLVVKINQRFIDKEEL